MMALFKSKWLIVCLILIDILLFLTITYDELTHYLHPTMPAWATHQAIADIATCAMFFMFCFMPVYFVYYVLLSQKLLKNQHSQTALLILTTVAFVALKFFVMGFITAVIYLTYSV